MTVLVFNTSEDVHFHIGKPIGPGPWMTLDQARIDMFAKATGDHQWIHTDPERASSGPYGTTIAHGYLTLSLIPRLAADLYTLAFGSARVNYGCNKVRYPAPIRTGSRIRATATPITCSTTDRGTLVTTKFAIEVDNDDRPALVAETLTLVVP
ncbi:MaoC family dehydratase [Nocardia australiensis]|uniref:MaoC family dehydratase n=1 Tax=Nocardia australiensis TaxID=2887191 RepID=UPI001D159617|nr:MaoC family dehydratase [Nocardia australiensis]